MVSEAQSPTLELDSLASLDHRELCLADTGGFDHLGVDDARPVFADRPHGQLRFERHAELAYEDDVEWHVEGQCDLQGHRDTAAGQPDDDDIGAAEALQPPREDPSGLGTIREQLLHLRVQGPPVSSGARRRGARRRAARPAPPGTPWRPAPGPRRSRR